MKEYAENLRKQLNVGLEMIAEGIPPETLLSEEEAIALWWKHQGQPLPWRRLGNDLLLGEEWRLAKVNGSWQLSQSPMIE